MIAREARTPVVNGCARIGDAVGSGVMWNEDALRRFGV